MTRFDGMLRTADAHTEGSVYQVRLDDAFDRVEAAVSQPWVRHHGPITPDQDAAPLWLAREAGYLIGVRLRAADEAR